MSEYIGTILAEAERPEENLEIESGQGPGADELERLGKHNFGATSGIRAERNDPPHFCQKQADMGHPVSMSGIGSESPHAAAENATEVGNLEDDVARSDQDLAAEFFEICGPGESEEERERRTYRGRTVGMLRRYLQCSIDTGRLPSLLGREFFRAKVTSYTAVTFEDRVIFVHDMERCLDRLDEFSRQLIARHILQEHDRWATARLLHCNEKTVRRLTPLALDQLAEILLDLGLMERLDTNYKKPCQGGLEDELSVSDCEDGENKF